MAAIDVVLSHQKFVFQFLRSTKTCLVSVKMSSNFWALSAAKKKTELVPGTSKWVANELSTINDVVLDHNDKIYQTLQDSYKHMNSFMNSVLQGIDDKQFVKELMVENSFLLNQTSPSNFTYIAPDLPSSVKASPINSSETSKEARIPHFQPLKPISPQFIPVEPSGPDFPPISGESDTQSKIKNIQTKDSILHQTEINDSKRPTIETKSPQAQLKVAKSPPAQQKKTNSPKLAKPANPIFTNVASPVSSPLQTRLKGGDSLSKKVGTNVFITKTPSPLKESNPRVDTSKGETEEEKEAQEADDSFQAISTAIRKSIAGKIALGTSEASNTPSSPPREIHLIPRERSSTDISNRLSMKEKLTRKSFLSKAPKRSSIFISLPSKEPIPVSSSSISNNGIRSRSLRVFERLDIASRHETSKNTKNSNFSLSPVALPKDSLLLASASLDMKLSKLEPLNGQNLPHQTNINKTHTQPQARRIDAVKKATEESKESSKKNNGTSHNEVNDTRAESTKKSHTLNLLQNSNIPNLVKEENPIQFHDYNSFKDSKSPTSSISRVTIVNQRGSRSTTTSISPVRSKPLASHNSTTRSPVGASTRTPSLSAGRSRSTSPKRVHMNSRSPSTSPKRANINSRSPTLHQSVLRLTSRAASPDSRGSGNDLELISRLMAPTSSSAAKSKSSYRVQKPTKELKKPESINTKNRFLTTTLIPTIPKFNPQKPPQFNHVSSKHVKAHHSPIKRRAPAMDEAESKPGNTLESLQIPSLKKKSMMAERSEAAAQKPKQKIMLAMNHKLELKLNHPKPDVTRRQKTEGAIVSPKVKLLTGQQLNWRDDNFTSRHNIGNSIPLPDAARGNLRKLNDANKRQDSKDTSPTKPKLAKSKILGKKASRISGVERRTTTDPHTPGKQYTPETLPDIHTDDEDSGSGKNEKILQSWGHTPELHRIIMQNKSINPTSVFGEVPKLNIEDIFESQSSRQRGKQSPQIPPDKKQLQREESQYAIEMGYK